MGLRTHEGDEFVVPRTRRLWLFSRFPEPVPVDFYRWTGKLRATVLMLFLMGNFLVALDIDAIGYDPEFYWLGMAINSPIVALDIVIDVLMWRGHYTTKTLRRMNITCMLLEVTSVALLLWAHGTVSSHILVFSTLMLFLYRSSFDFVTGFTTLVAILTTHWGLLIAELRGWLPHKPLLMESVNIPPFPQRDLGVMLIVTIVFITAFIAADWTVARLRHKELAIRILRETLAANDVGKVGRHTGRALKDTYVVGPLISAGGMGEVYRGHHRRTKRKVAIKILHPHLMEDEVLLKRFRREAEITGQLGSPNIVDVIDVDRDAELAFLVLELLEGEDLAARIARSGTLPLPEVARIIGEAADGLSVAHKSGVVHRDLKPENLFLAQVKNGEVVKILDFGVSKIHGNATAITQEVALLGTPNFMSPEQAMGQAADIDVRTDVFALACITYNAITGHRPFVASSIPALLRRICDEAPPAISKWRKDVPGDVALVLRIGMAKDPDQRYADALSFRDDLMAALAGELDDSVRERAAKVHAGLPSTSTATGDPHVDHLAATVEANISTDDTVAQS